MRIVAMKSKEAGMTEKEKLAAAEEFVRKAVSRLSCKATEEAIKAAAAKAAQCIPPFKETRAVKRARAQIGGCCDSIRQSNVR